MRMPEPEGRPVAPQPLRLERLLHALGDPVRLGIVRQLARDGESSCAALDGGRSKSTMSHHFRVLREAGLVETRNVGHDAYERAVARVGRCGLPGAARRGVGGGEVMLAC